jgi:hypothetical protein
MPSQLVVAVVEVIAVQVLEELRGVGLLQHLLA